MKYKSITHQIQMQPTHFHQPSKLATPAKPQHDLAHLHATQDKLTIKKEPVWRIESKAKKAWTMDEDRLLAKLVEEHGARNWG